MNHRTIALLALIAIAVVVAPVMLGERKATAAGAKCGILMKFDKKSKSCVPKS
jgi:hypothetical protein